MNDTTVRGISFRPIEAADEQLLGDIYASTRTEEMKLVPHWTEADISAFLKQQFTAQHIHYQNNYPKADFQIILYEGREAGRLYVDRRPLEIRIVDITLLPDFRNRGLGEGILRSILDEGTALGQPVSIHVERFNPALKLYERLGFRMIDDSNDVYLLLERRP